MSGRSGAMDRGGGRQARRVPGADGWLRRAFIVKATGEAALVERPVERLLDIKGDVRIPGAKRNGDGGEWFTHRAEVALPGQPVIGAADADEIVVGLIAPCERLGHR